MSSKTRIVVLHMKEIIYTAVFAILGILILVLLFFMFSPDRETGGQAGSGTYEPGIYTSGVTLNSTELEVEVAVDENSRISSIRLVNLDDSVSAMYPLVQPAVEDLAEQIYETQSLENIQLSEDSPYTSPLLLNAIGEALAAGPQ